MALHDLYAAAPNCPCLKAYVWSLVMKAAAAFMPETTIVIVSRSLVCWSASPNDMLFMSLMRSLAGSPHGRSILLANFSDLWDHRCSLARICASLCSGYCWRIRSKANMMSQLCNVWADRSGCVLMAPHEKHPDFASCSALCTCRPSHIPRLQCPFPG